MLKDIWIPKLTDILPPNILADEKLYAAAEALDLQLKALSNDAWQVLHIPRLDELNHDVLDNLAWQFHVDHYEPSTMSLDVKRNLIRQSIAWHKIKGTPASVENFLGAFGINAEVQEWWEYGGEPYFFKLKLSDIAYMGDDGDTFTRLIYAAKNERSWLDRFIFDLTREPPDQNIYVTQPTNFAHREFYAINNWREEKTSLSVAMPTSYAGNENHSYNGTATKTEKSKVSYGIITRVAGKIQYRATMPPEPEYDSDFEKLLWERWRYWRNNPVVRHYCHHFDDEGEIDPDDPNIDEPFPLDRDFLRLYFSFPKNRVRWLTVYNPRSDLVGADINAVGYYAAANKTLINSYGHATTGIKRALLISKSIDNILGGHPPKNDNGKFHAKGK